MSEKNGDADADASMTCWGQIKRKGKVIMSDLDLLNYYETKLGSGSFSYAHIADEMFGDESVQNGQHVEELPAIGAGEIPV